MIETVDVSVVDDLPAVLQLIAAVRANHRFTQAYLAREFKKQFQGRPGEIRKGVETHSGDI